MHGSQGKWLLDTNVLIDLAVPSRPQHDTAVRLLEVGARSAVDFHILVSSLKDMYYIMNKQKGHGDESIPEAHARGVVRQFIEFFKIIDQTEEIARNAVDSDEPDFEDGLVRAAAEICGCDYLVTRDATGFENGFVKKLSPSDALALLTE